MNRIKVAEMLNKIKFERKREIPCQSVRKQLKILKSFVSRIITNRGGRGSLPIKLPFNYHFKKKVQAPAKKKIGRGGRQEKT